MESQIDQQELQRLLDGRLPECERIAFLQSVDERPEQWRTVALAFVEEQVLRSEMRQWAATYGVPAQTGKSSADASDAGEDGKDEDRKATPRNSAQRQAANGKVWHWVSAAVLLVAGIFAGTALPLSWFRSTPDDVSVEGVPQEEPQDRNYYVVLPGAAEAESGPETMLDVEEVASSIFDQRSRDVLRRHGYDVNEEPIVFVFEDDQGGRYWIPQRRVSLVAHQESK